MREIWIVGNGPSVTPEVLDTLADKETFGLNLVGVMFPYTKWRPTIGGVFTIYSGAGAWNDYIQAMVDLGIPVYMRSQMTQHFFGANIIPTACFRALVGGEHLADTEFWMVPTSVLVCGSATYPAAQVAVTLGYKMLHFIGMDGYKAWHWGEADPNHWHPDYGLDAGTHLSERGAAWWNVRTELGYIRMLTTMRRLGVQWTWQGRPVSLPPQ